MGQKSNILTLRNKKVNLNLLKKNSKEFLYGFTFLNYFDNFLKKKSIFIADRELNFIGNQAFFVLNLFYRSNKISKYKKKYLSKKLRKKNNKRLNIVSNPTNLNTEVGSPSSKNYYDKTFSKKIPEITKVASKKKDSKRNSFLNLFLLQLKKMKINLVALNFKNLNINVSPFFFRRFYSKIKAFKNTLFERRLHLLIDFLKISALFYTEKINLSSYLYFLGQIFRFLQKKNHTRFFFFLRIVFNFFIEFNVQSFLKKSNLLNLNQIQGIKLVANGKLRGKTRASSSCLQVGTVPIQSVHKNVDFSKIHIYTRYGVFGFQMWIFRNLITKK